MPKGKTIIHATLDPLDLNKDVEADHALIGDAGADPRRAARRGEGPAEGQAARRGPTASPPRSPSSTDGWLEDWTPKLTDTSTPINPYRVIWDLLHTVDVAEHDHHPRRRQPARPDRRRSGSRPRRCRTSAGARRPSSATASAWRWAPSWPTRTSCASTSGATRRSASPGMDFETAVRERIPIMSFLMNNFSMAIELKVMPVSTEKYRSTDISGNYADMAQGVRRLRRARHRPERDHPGDQARHQEDPGRACRSCWSSSPRRRPASPRSTRAR